LNTSELIATILKNWPGLLEKAHTFLFIFSLLKSQQVFLPARQAGGRILNQQSRGKSVGRWLKVNQ
jgi:hypothetical protein